MIGLRLQRRSESSVGANDSAGIEQVTQKLKTTQGLFLQTYNFRQTHAYVYVYLCDFSIHISKEDQKESTPFYKNAGARVEKKGTLLQHWWG